MKILSIVVPSYNAENYLRETIPTMLPTSNLDKLEIIIINDGSKDNTLSVANQLKVNYPETIVVLNKENGGHGSTINEGIKVATGKYFKVIDADDWVNTENLSALIDYLTVVDDDEVISPFIKVYMDSNHEEIYSYKVGKQQITYKYSEFLSEINELPKMHAITIKTDILRDNKIQIDENCFYVDLEYNTFPMPYIKTISYFDRPIYRYRLGSPTQSVSMENYIKNVKMHKKVISSLIDFYHSYPQATKIEKELLDNLLGEVITIHSNIYLSMSDIKQARKDFIDFEREVNVKSAHLFNSVKGNKIKLLRMSRYTLFSLLSKFYRKSLL